MGGALASTAHSGRAEHAGCPGKELRAQPGRAAMSMVSNERSPEARSKMSHAARRRPQIGRLAFALVLLGAWSPAGCGGGPSLAGDQDAVDVDAGVPDGRDDAEVDATPDTIVDPDADAIRDADADVSPDVTAGVCGDGVRNVGEGCDDGNGVDDDECRNDCSLPMCGDGVTSDVEECDDGPASSDTEPNACRTRCVRPTCGDGVVDTGERCDDGNRMAGDTCSPGCFPDEEAPAEPVGDPVAADDSFDAGGPPVVDWNGTGWGVVWGAWGPLRFRALDADAHPIGPPGTLPVDGGYVALAWGEDRFAFAAANWSHYEVAVGTVDGLGALRSGPTWMPAHGEHPGIAWSPALGGWIVTYNAYEDATTILAARIDDDSRIADGPIAIGEGLGPVPAPLRSRVAIVWSGAGGIRYRGFPWPEVGLGRELLALPMGIISDGSVTAEGYNDFVLAAAMDGDAVRVVVVDALAGEVASGPFAVASSGIADRRPSLRAVPERGIVGLCYETGPGPAGGSDGDDGIAFRVLRPDGALVGAEVTVAAGLRNAGGCDVGWSGTEFVVLYWSCGGDSEWNTIYAQRVRPLL
ncbi:MAG: DUF4215 domain-containing protein [Deltaproteobacteria bacterium]|nr:DUF4215 domain-containing protein [Deltaproteobacteria bacterium]